MLFTSQTARMVVQAHQYRPDIDGLRAIAVGSVLIFHAFPALLPGGFVGVDIFFVISGYLITGLILSDLRNGRFSIANFYARRIVRIFPALITVLVACLVAGWFLFLFDEYMALGKHAAAGAAFIANIVYWLEAGYFDVSAEKKPLLHLWSLAVEEQYYIIWPALMALTWRWSRGLLGVVVAVTLLSFAANLFYIDRDPSFAFYSPVTRFWELGIGSALACIGAMKGQGRVREAIAIGGILLLALSVAIIPETGFPGWWALLPTIGSAAVLYAAPGTMVGRLLSTRPMVGVGLISYPLYLWHWPLLSFPAVILEETSYYQRAMAVVLSVVLAWLTYAFIEKPIRFGPNRRSPRTIVPLLASLFAIFAAGSALHRNEGFQPFRAKLVPQLTDLRKDLEWPYHLNTDCLKRYPYRPANFGFWFCVTNRDAPPEVMIIGNSFANDIYWGMMHNPDFKDRTVLNIGSCFSAINVDWRYPQQPANHPCSGERKVANEHVIDRVIEENLTSLKLVVLNSGWLDFRDDGSLWTGEFIATDDSGAPIEPRLSSENAFMAGLEKRIAYLEERNIATVLMLPKPELDVPITQCFGRPFIAAKSTCQVPRDKALTAQANFRNAVAGMAKRHPSLMLYDKYPPFCDATTCRFIDGEHPLLRDRFHLSMLGAKRLIDDFAPWYASRSGNGQHLTQ